MVEKNSKPSRIIYVYIYQYIYSIIGCLTFFEKMINHIWLSLPTQRKLAFNIISRAYDVIHRREQIEITNVDRR